MQYALIVCLALLYPVWELFARVPVLAEAATFVGTCTVTVVASYWLAVFIWSRALRRVVDTDKKAVLVTGCDTGFGYLAAKRFADDGFAVFAACLNASSDGAKELTKRHNVRVVPLDITKDDQVQRALTQVKDGLGSNELWAVVANAGVTGLGLVEWNSMERIKNIFEVNVFGHMRVAKAFLPLLKTSRGRLVIVTSGLCTQTHCYQTRGKISSRKKERRHWAKFTGNFFYFITRDNPMEVVDQMSLAVRDQWPRTCYRSMALTDKFYLLFAKSCMAIP
ncbi:hypothetical protein HPB48_023020 [Haemaphysalis longicornis]|uniref:Uncharacterized protein n=1 Tax=Haemaphysalis longicornis TaxID=44386 RepID=A0A9J6GZZ6_HAELO|nr:hypothetical protein HPB48_023020 [Haemaphysalis longicornis]